MTRAGRGLRPGTLLALAAAALGVATARAGTVAVLRSADLAPYRAVAESFRGAYDDGPILDLTLDPAAPDSALARLVGSHVDAIVAIGLRAAVFARDRMPRTPLVFCMVQNWEHADLDASWVTGVSTDVPLRVELQSLRDAAPGINRVGVLYGRANATLDLRAARAAAAATGLTLVERPLAALTELPQQARELADKCDALWMPADPTIGTPEAFQFLLELSLQRRLPLLVFSETLVHAGAFVAVAPDYGWVGREVADRVRRIHAGDRPGDIPIGGLRHTRVVINLATARALGRTVPASALGNAEVLP